MGTLPNGESVPFGTQSSKKSLIINITNLTEEQKNKLRGALKFFTGDRNNTAVKIINEKKELPAGGIFLNANTIEQIEEIAGKENINLN